MAAKQSSETSSDAFIQAASNFSSFLDSLAVGSDSGHQQIRSLDEFKEVIHSYITAIKQNAFTLPPGFNKTKINKFLTRKEMSDNGNGLNMIGGIIMANLCIMRLRRISQEGGELGQLATERIPNFFNKEFVELFAQQLPFRGNTDDRGTGILRRGNQAKTKKGSTDEEEEEASSGSYTKFLNELFSVDPGSRNWRGEILAPVSNDLQCLRAMGLPDSASTVVDIHNNGLIKEKGKRRENLDCYICGCKIKSQGTRNNQQDKMQCEHILPILTALGHWWLVKPKDRTPQDLVKSGLYSPYQLSLLNLEYDWSHACCNLVKNNWEIIRFDITKKDPCQPFTEGITALLQAIWEGHLCESGNRPPCNASTGPANYDCDRVDMSTGGCINELFDGELGSAKATKKCNRQKLAIKLRLKKLTDIISQNILETNDYQIYQLLTKFKVMAAINDENFIRALLNITGDIDDDAVVNASASEKQRRTNEKLAEVQYFLDQHNSISESIGVLEKPKFELPEIEKDIRVKSDASKRLKRKITQVRNAATQRNRNTNTRREGTTSKYSSEGMLKQNQDQFEQLTDELQRLEGEYMLKQAEAEKNEPKIKERVILMGKALEHAESRWLEYTEIAGDTADKIIDLGKNELDYELASSNNREVLEVRDILLARREGLKASNMERDNSMVTEKNDGKMSPMESHDEGDLAAAAAVKAPAEEEEEVPRYQLLETLRRYPSRQRRRPDYFGRGGKVPRSNNNLDVVTSSVTVPNPNIKTKPSVTIPNPEYVKPKIDIQVSSSDASGSEVNKSNSDDTDRNVKLFISAAINGEAIGGKNFYFGPTHDDIKKELVRLFVGEDISKLQSSLKYKIVHNTVEGFNDDTDDEEEAKKGGKTRKRRAKKRKTKKRKTKKQKTKRRKSRRRNKSTKKRRKRRKN